MLHTLIFSSFKICSIPFSIYHTQCFQELLAEWVSMLHRNQHKVSLAVIPKWRITRCQIFSLVVLRLNFLVMLNIWSSQSEGQMRRIRLTHGCNTRPVSPEWHLMLLSHKCNRDSHGHFSQNTFTKRASTQIRWRNIQLFH